MLACQINLQGIYETKIWRVNDMMQFNAPPLMTMYFFTELN